MKILIADDLSENGIALLKDVKFEIFKTTVAQNQLENFINSNRIDVLIVNSATKVTRELVDACPTLKLIGRAGVNMDNIAVSHAINKGLKIINTPLASANSVAELVFAHLFGMVRFLHQANREMPLEGDTRFNDLRKQFSTGTELKGKTLGIIGFGNIGKEVAKTAIGIGMKVITTSSSVKKETIDLTFYNGKSIAFEIETQSLEILLKESDFITIHTPYQGAVIIGKQEIELMKTGVGIINTSQGGTLDEIALINAIEAEKVKYAALDVYETEPKPEIQLLMNPELSLTPHIGGKTRDAKHRAETELINQLVYFRNNYN